MKTNQSIPDLRFRILTPEDAQELSYLELEIFPTPWSENALRMCLELSTVEGEAALINRKMVGYLFAQYVHDEAHLLNVGVRQRYRRRSIGRQLLERFLKHCKTRGIKVCFLEVRTGNRAAHQLYFQYGFAPLSVRKGYYPNGEDALILIKRLENH